MSLGSHRLYYVNCQQIHQPTADGWPCIATNVFDAATNMLNAHWKVWEEAHVRVCDGDETYQFRCERFPDHVLFEMVDA